LSLAKSKLAGLSGINNIYQTSVMRSKGYAMHLGLNKVDPVHYQGLHPLTCCVNDAESFAKVSSALEFAKSLLLPNEKATTHTFIETLDQWSKELEEGDLLWVTYSGHGGRKPDLNGDEKNDNWDETWCLYNREFIDDEQFQLYKQFKQGVRILIFSDSCYSGTVARALPADVDENGGELTGWDSYKKWQGATSRMAPIKGCVDRYINNKNLYNQVLSLPAVKKEDIDAYVILFSSCKDDQECIEYGSNGYFTSAMLTALNSLDQIRDYEQLYKRLQNADLGGQQNANLDYYGNEQYNFLKSLPLSLSGEPARISILKPTEGGASGIDTDQLIVHEESKSRAGSTSVSGDPVRRIEAALSGRTSWDKAYDKYFALKFSGKNAFVEPNIPSRYQEKKSERGNDANDYLSHWPKPTQSPTEFIWHLDEEHSQLRKAADAVRQKWAGNTEKIIRIAHIDTGYRDHVSKPLYLNVALARNFINGQDANDAQDRFNTGFPAEQDGHGCATLAILAGNKIFKGDGYTDYEGYYGAIPFAEVIPIRICETVYNLFNANDVADAIDYAVEQKCEVITMSMAGYPTKAVAAAVNYAYEKGVIIVTAAGNNWYEGIAKLAPKSVLYPARFKRVIAATGACYDQFPYDHNAPRTNVQSKGVRSEVMQGNWGPESAMDCALAAYTPNLPWANTGAGDKFQRAGAGTSSATPQIAAAAALWISYNRDKLGSVKDSWKKVEAARRALFSTASKAYPLYKKYYGNGILRAFKALEAFKFSPEEISSLEPSEKAKVSFLGIIPFFKQWFRGRGTHDNEKEVIADDTFMEMLSLEVLQLIHKDATLMDFAENLDLDNELTYEFLREEEGRENFLKAVHDSAYASDKLKRLTRVSLEATEL
jgi:subtilisin family serine protease